MPRSLNGEWLYSSTHEPQTQMEISGQLNAPATFTVRKEPRAPTLFNTAIYVFLLEEVMYSYCCLCILIVSLCIIIVVLFILIVVYVFLLLVYVFLLLSMYSYCYSMYYYCCLCILIVSLCILIVSLCILIVVYVFVLLFYLFLLLSMYSYC